MVILDYIRIVFLSLSFSFIPTLIIFYVLYGIHELIHKEILPDSVSLVFSGIIYVIFFIVSIAVSIEMMQKGTLEPINVISFSSLDFYNTITIILNIVVAFFSAGIFACIICDVVPFIRNLKHKSAKAHTVIMIVIFIIYLPGFFDLSSNYLFN